MVEKDRDQYAMDIITALTERTIKRLWVTIILLIVLLVASNAAWIYYESQFEVVETTTQTVEQDSGEGGTNSFVGSDNYAPADGENSND